MVEASGTGSVLDVAEVRRTSTTSRCC